MTETDTTEVPAPVADRHVAPLVESLKALAGSNVATADVDDFAGDVSDVQIEAHTESGTDTMAFLDRVGPVEEALKAYARRDVKLPERRVQAFARVLRGETTPDTDPDFPTLTAGEVDDILAPTDDEKGLFEALTDAHIAETGEDPEEIREAEPVMIQLETGEDSPGPETPGL